MIAVGRARRGVDEALDAGVARGDQHVEEAGGVGGVRAQRILDRARHRAERGLVQDDVDAFAGAAACVGVDDVAFEKASACATPARRPTRRTSSRLLRWPVAKLSRLTTSWPRRSSVSSRCEPMKPALPVTSQRCGRARSAAQHAAKRFGRAARIHDHSLQTLTPRARNCAASAWHLTSTYSPPSSSLAT